MLTKTRTASFIRHYVEMVVVMFAGMIVLGLPGEAALHAIGSGTSELRNDAPTLVFLGMAFTMTARMVAWMRYRGHRFHRAAGCRGRTARFAGRAGCLACAHCGGWPHRSPRGYPPSCGVREAREWGCGSVCPQLRGYAVAADLAPPGAGPRRGRGRGHRVAGVRGSVVRGSARYMGALDPRRCSLASARARPGGGLVPRAHHPLPCRRRRWPRGGGDGGP